MALPKKIVIKETEKEIKKLLKQSIPFIGQRLRVLLVLKQNEEIGISKRDAAKLTGVDPNSIQNWRALYIKYGINGLMKHNKIGFKQSVFTEIEHKKIEEKLNDPKNGLQGYVELKSWIEHETGRVFNYNTLLYYCIKNFKSSVKVARKSHIKKDDNKVEAFKKTSGKSAKK